MTRLQSRLCLLAGCAVIYAPAAYAQGAPAAGANEAVELDEVVITAEKREGNLQSTPISVSALGAEALQDAGVANATDLTNLVPNVQIGFRGENVEVAIRGVGSTNNTEVGNPAIALNIDGVYVARPAAAAAAFYDLERVEVLRGPQGTLYGKNATAGAINLVTAKPKLNSFEGAVRGEFGNFQTRRLDGVANIPIGDAAAIRAAVSYNVHDGYLETVNPAAGVTKNSDDQNSLAARLQLKIEPTDRLSVLLSADYLQIQGIGPAEVQIPLRPGDLARVNPLNTQGSRDAEYTGFLANVTYDFEGFRLVYLGSIRTERREFVNDIDMGLTFPREGRFNNSERQSSNELRIESTGDGPLTWTIGGIYFKEENDVFFQITKFPIPIFTQIFDQPDVYERSKGLFGQATYAANDRLNFTAGLRYTDDQKGRVGTATIYNTLTNGIINRVTNIAEISSTRLDYKLGVDYQVGDRSMIYASYTTGYKAGGFSDGGGVGSPPALEYGPETISAIELGSKNRFLENRLQVNATVFRYNYEGFQVSRLEDRGGGVIGTVTRNADRARIQGVEIESNMLVGENGRLNASVAYLDARFTDFIFPAATVFGAPIAQRDLAGYALPKSPKWQVSLGYDHSFPLSNGASIRARVQSRYSAGYFLSFYNLSAHRQNSFTSTDANLGYWAEGDAWFIEAFVKNVEDEAVLTTLNISSSVNTTGSLAPPKTYGIRLGAKF